ncbi:transcriptional regulator, AraC family [Phyllobacterium sp. YR620]|uniref:helix-turn-helix domain-containing protein n=1 Tax=Phyllobacterium sp. YR620 TaxID=1881066 RepID=UPI0008851016|nr:helix-turn-helix domain-containing protein [Phyllobacterium sp. YR620]SDP48434.1 transcriptional regulator, AraC family [Phyllobacterium sp. YR620]
MSDKDYDYRSNPAATERRRWPRVSQDPLGEGKAVKTALVPLRFASEELPPHKQFQAWQEHMAVLSETRLPDDVDPKDGFIVKQTVWHLDGMLFVQQTAPAFSYERSPNMVRFSPIDHWQITLLRAGRTWTGMDGRVAQNEPGRIEVRSLGHPFSGRAIATDSLSLIVPVDLFADRGGLTTASHNVVLGGHRAKLLIDHLSSVEANLEHFAQEDVPGIKDRLREMIFDTITPLVDRDGVNDQISQLGLMTRARRFILSNLASPALTPDALGRELAISRTRLYELFETSGGVANYIRRRRLSAAHAMLADPSDPRKIAEVGLAIGFDSAANFSRAFTQQFGYSPSNIQKRSFGDHKRPDMPRDGTPKVTFETLLRTLGLS